MDKPAVLPKGRRSRTGCGTCRARKVKCDERPNGCANCERLQIQCIRGDAARVRHHADKDPGAPSIDNYMQQRTFRSCKSCRSAKVRCSGERPACERCRARHHKCEYDGKEAPRWINRVSDYRTRKRTNQRRGQSLPHSEDSFNEFSNDEQCKTSGIDAPPLHREEEGSGFVKLPRESQGMVTESDCPRHLTWLFAESLPSYEYTRHLVDLYFKLIHPLRCFGFVHRPTFEQVLEDLAESDYNNSSLLLMMCALGAKFYATAELKAAHGDELLALQAGSQWAAQAQQIMFQNLNTPTPETVMVAILLHEHELRVGGYAGAFMITGVAVRLVQGLQLNVEPIRALPRIDSVLSPDSFIETCRRIMWSIYIMDAWIGSGVDNLSFVQDKHVNIRLPSKETDFILESTEDRPAPYALQENDVGAGRSELDVAAQFVLLVGLRKKVLRFVKHLHETQPPWEDASDFKVLLNGLTDWYNSLPASLAFNRSAIQKRKLSGQHGALFLLHITYHQTMCDLNRIAMPELFRLKVPVLFPEERRAFEVEVQDTCFDHCVAIGNVFREALQHGYEAFADTWLCVVAHDSIRVMVHYFSKKLGSVARHADDTIHQTVRSACSANIQALERLIPSQHLAKSLHTSALMTINQSFLEPLPVEISANPEDSSVEEIAAREASPNPQTPEAVLNPLAIYRMARQHIKKTSRSARHSTGRSIGASTTSDRSVTPITGMEVESASSQIITPDTGVMLPSSPVQEFSSCQNGLLLELPQMPMMGFDNFQVYMSLPPVLYGCDSQTFNRGMGVPDFNFHDNNTVNDYRYMN